MRTGISSCLTVARASAIPGSDSSLAIPHSLLTQRPHLLSLLMRLGLLIQQVGNVNPTAYVSALGNPLQTHGRSLTKPACQQELRPVPLAACPQIILIPAQPFDFFLHNPLGFLRGRGQPRAFSQATSFPHCQSVFSQACPSVSRYSRRAWSLRKTSSPGHPGSARDRSRRDTPLAACAA